MMLVIYTDGFFFQYKKRNISFWNRGLAHFNLSVPAQKSLALLSLDDEVVN